VLALAGCAAVRVLPVAAPGVEVDAATGRATVSAPGLVLAVQPSAWTGPPVDLADYVTPLHVELTNASAQPLDYGYPDFLLFDEARFQYAALPPAEVARILRAELVGGPRLAASATLESRPGLRRWRADPSPFWSPWWGPWGPWGDPWYPYVPRIDAVLTEALAVGTLTPGARQAGFVYFPRLRPAATRLAFEFHYRLGDLPGVLVVPLAVDRAGRPVGRSAA
jgi:hypothetical protein